MSITGNICAVILAAGQSRRFGTSDKLAALLHGKMLGLYVAETVSDFAFKNSAVIVQEHTHPCVPVWQGHGFDIIANPVASLGIGTSVASAASFAKACGADALLICLADMPFVPKQHFEALLDAFAATGGANIIASHSGKSQCPPAIFAKQYFDNLMELDSDNGARLLLDR